MKQGADPNIGKASTYPLYAATNLQNFEMMDLLIKYGANMDIPKTTKRTPIKKKTVLFVAIKIEII